MTDAPRPRGNYRWVICALLFFATTINYVDRSVFGVLESELVKIIKWNDFQFGVINSSFSLAYAIGFLFAGRIMDRYGVRVGYAASLVLWSIAAAAHALADSVVGFVIARFALGLGESGNFPAAIKTVAEWFPRKERAFATGIFNSGSNIGAILAPWLVPILFLHYGWQSAFIATGLAGIIWVFFWWPLYRRPQEHPQLSPEELAYIESDPADPPTPIKWLDLIPFRQTWAFAIGKFLTDSVWWFYVFWFPKFMNDQFGVDIKGIGAPMITVFLLADVGSIAGGWLSSRLLAKGWTPNAARKSAMLLCALCVVPVIAAPMIEPGTMFMLGEYTVDRYWIAVLLIGLAASAHQGFSANLFTLTSDMFPRHAVGSVVGMGGFAGAMGGFLMNLGAGALLQLRGQYLAMFVAAGLAYLVALLVIHILVPQLEPIHLSRGEAEEAGSQ
jgi:ACS family hexuronate transporter-like MFS transporter